MGQEKQGGTVRVKPDILRPLSLLSCPSSYFSLTIKHWGPEIPKCPEKSTWSVWKGSGSNFLFYNQSQKPQSRCLLRASGLPLGVSLAVHRVLAIWRQVQQEPEFSNLELEYGVGRSLRLVSSHTFFLHRRAELTSSLQDSADWNLLECRAPSCAVPTVMSKNPWLKKKSLLLSVGWYP